MRSPHPQQAQRRSYRRRRVADAARLVPLAGVILLMVPLLLGHASDPDETVRTSTVTLYVFGIWVLLIVITRMLAKGISDASEPPSALEPRETRETDLPGPARSDTKDPDP